VQTGIKICKTASTKVTQKLARALLKSFQVSARTRIKLYADMLGRGLGVEKDLVKSYEVFKSLCENGSSEACYELATKYLQENGVEQSFDLSANALDKACNVLELVSKN